MGILISLTIPFVAVYISYSPLRSIKGQTNIVALLVVVQVVSKPLVLLSTALGPRNILLLV